MRCYYDLHIHTALSPCAENEMTPTSIAVMAGMRNLDIIAITDHNSAKNVRAVSQAAKSQGVLVVPGLELTTVEGIHILCLFYEIEGAEAFSEYVDTIRAKVPIEGDKFRQYVLDSKDHIIGMEQNILYLPATIGINDVCRVVREFNGIAIPAHIDRPVTSIYSVLGGFYGWEYGTVEVTNHSFMRTLIALDDYRFLKNSDAHSLNQISERDNYIELEEISVKCLLDTLAQQPM